jgi:energy-coupling factor transport system ATP-binding protein
MIRLRQAGYRHRTGNFQLGPIDLTVEAGERLLITGRSGSGKSTLLRLMAGLLQRHGRGQVQGAIQVAGQDPGGLEAAARVSTLGFVSQDPEDATLCGAVEDEIGFSLENRGDAPEHIRQRIAELLTAVNLVGRNRQDPRRLSGGQQQRMMVAAALAGAAPVLLLDEPLAQLDPIGAEELLHILRKLSEEGVAVVMVEHRLELALPWATRCVVMATGKVVADPLLSPAQLSAWGLEPPTRDRLSQHVPPPWRARHPRRWSAPEVGDIALTATNLRFGWPGQAPLFDGLHLHLRRGERVALMGANGVGKSSLLRVLAGRQAPQLGTITGERAVVVPQNPDLSLFCATVEEELGFAMAERGEAPADRREKIALIADRFGLQDSLTAPPQALSRGQRLRVAVAAALGAEPGLLLLDEPTAGQDLPQVERMFRGLPTDIALLFACHDPEVVLREATRLWVLYPGGFLDGPPVETLQRALELGCPLRRPPLMDIGIPLGIDPTNLDVPHFATLLEHKS